jgi:hypothetical protein
MKGKINFIIDVIMFLLMAVLAGVGLLIKYVLLSGENRWIKYGRNVDLSFWGLDRHEWGTIHLWIAIALVALLVLHIILHWNMIICLYKKIIGNKTGRIICGSALSVITLLFVVFPFLIKVNMAEIAPGRERFESTDNHKNQRSIKDDADHAVSKEEIKLPEQPMVQNTTTEKEIIAREEHNDEHHLIDPAIEVKGYQTLNEVSELYNIPVNVISKKLNIPESTLGSSKLGHLRKQYGFTMSDIELIIHNYKNQ